MQRNLVFAVCAIALGTLAACGQKSANKDADAQSAPQAASAPVSAPASAANSFNFSDCFTLEPNVTYHLSHGGEISISQGTFNKQPAVAYTSDAEGSKVSEFYDSTGRKMLGTISYGIAALGGNPNKADTTETYAPPKEFPADAKPGARFVVTIPQLTTYSHASKEKMVDEPSSLEYVFVGFEDVTIDGDTRGSENNEKIHGACHLQQTTEGNLRDLWYAPGLGMVKFTLRNGETLIMSDTIIDKPTKGAAAK